MKPLVFASLSLFACQEEPPNEAPSPPETTTPGPADDQVTLETAGGTIVISLFVDAAPETVANFLSYVDAGFYDGADGDGAGTFYRSVPGFVLQGGGVRTDGSQKETSPPIANEALASGLSNLANTLAMARTDDPDSATTEFFVNLVDNTFLDPGGATVEGYAVFGEVIEGMPVIDEIVDQPTSGETLLDPVPFVAATRSP